MLMLAETFINSNALYLLSLYAILMLKICFILFIFLLSVAYAENIQSYSFGRTSETDKWSEQTLRKIKDFLKLFLGK